MLPIARDLDLSHRVAKRNLSPGPPVRSLRCRQQTDSSVFAANRRNDNPVFDEWRLVNPGPVSSFSKKLCPCGRFSPCTTPIRMNEQEAERSSAQRWCGPPEDPLEEKS